MTTTAETIDMSPAALAGRLEQVRALYKLMVYLGRARPVESADLTPPGDARETR